MRILFMGTPEFAVKSLEILVKSHHEVVGVVTAPDRPRGRGHKVTFCPVKEKALELKISVYQPEKIHSKEFRDVLDDLKPDLIITVCCSHYINKWIREYPPKGAINLHPSLLPSYRGCLPIREPIIRGDEKSGITTFYLDRGWDTGDIILQEETSLNSGETGGTLHDRLSVLGSEVLLKTVNRIEDGTAPRIPQDHSKASYTDKVFPEHGEIDWSLPAIDIERKVRAFNPIPGSFTSYKGKKLKIWDAVSLDEEMDLSLGTVLHSSAKKGLIIGTGKGRLEITSLQMPSKKRIGAKEFLRGSKIEEGTVFGE